MADQQNPYTMMGMMQMMQPNPYINAAYQNKPLPIPGFYGPATDAQGNTIQSYADTKAKSDAWNAANPQGTTLNTTPQPQQSQQPMVYDTNGVPLTGQAANWAAFDPSANVSFGKGVSDETGATGQQLQAQHGMAGSVGLTQGPSQQQPQQPQNPYDMRQAYIDALANPGKVTTPGANVPQASPLGQPSVLNAFLAAHPTGGTPAPAGGGYSNSGFFNTLNKLRSA